MLISLDTVREIFPRVNEIIHTDDDFWRAAKDRKIIVREEPMLIDGYYKFYKKKPYILINSNLKGMEWTRTAFHELTHDIFDVTEKKSSIKLYRNAQQLEHIREQRAEAIAALLLVPKWKLYELYETPFDQLSPFTQSLLLIRKKLHDDNNEL